MNLDSTGLGRSAALRAAATLAITLACATARADQPPASPSPVPEPTPAQLSSRRVSVDIASSKPDAVVERRVTSRDEAGMFLVLPWHSTESTWEQVCVAPCRAAELDRYSTYRVAAANGIASSPPFTLPQGRDSLLLQVDAGSRFAHRAGVALTSVGAVAVIVGVSLLIVASHVVRHDDQVETRDVGWVTGGVGIAAFGVGIPLTLLTRTTVQVDGQPLRAASGPRFTGSGFVF